MIRNILTLAPRIDSDSNKPDQTGYYGLYTACYLSMGLLFLNECKRKVKIYNKTDVCLLLLGCFPRWPNDTCDQRYHPQIFRHLITYVLGIKEDNKTECKNQANVENYKHNKINDSDIISSDDENMEISEDSVNLVQNIDDDLKGLGFSNTQLEGIDSNIEKIDDILVCLK